MFIEFYIFTGLQSQVCITESWIFRTVDVGRDHCVHLVQQLFSSRAIQGWLHRIISRFFCSISKVEDSTCASTQSSLTVKKLFLDVQRKPPVFVPHCLWSCHWTQLKGPWLCLYTLPWSNCICYWGIDQIPLRFLFPNLNRPISLSISLQERSFSPFTIFMLSLTCLQ